MTVTDQDFQLFIYALKTSSNYDFSEYSEKSLKRRLTKILVDNKLNLNVLINKLKNDKVFVEKIVKEIFTNYGDCFSGFHIQTEHRAPIHMKRQGFYPRG